MAWLVGIDEAGLGPNLGPMVVAATIWEVPDKPASADFWTTFADVLTNAPHRGDDRLHVADSKQVFQPAGSLVPLETAVWSTLGLAGIAPCSLHPLVQSLGLPEFPQHVPWGLHDFPLPLELTASVEPHVQRWQAACATAGWTLRKVLLAVVQPEDFNRRILGCDNKARVCSEIHLAILRSVWELVHDAPSLIVSDKHGGRNRYGDLLLDFSEGLLLQTIRESADLSAYRIGQAEFRFQPRAEAHGPVALASMCAKYVREVSMHQFNQFWQAHLPGLKRTQGYPVDARRFWSDITDVRERLQIPEAILWRCR